jgi:hypothetical protein
MTTHDSVRRALFDGLRPDPRGSVYRAALRGFRPDPLTVEDKRARVQRLEALLASAAADLAAAIRAEGGKP